ncbi:DUF3604 domain-containing protein [Parahaliea maris]|uniref:DUF3604 domain-containing protein n=1 Tax=Parahaliea maris TaxID=2716870 RepID=A0A5C9A5Q8_9GAMM|nr:DUF3604 domain-containing protein [Parahaliea maris]TXS96148.1 DUF3604 domain-containing protein [Parahaliea maris]
MPALRNSALAFVSLIAVGACSPVEDPSLFPAFDEASAGPPPAKPLVPPRAERQVFWGDLHIHTSLSTDAWTMGVRGLPDDAYTFTRGGTIEHPLGYPIRLHRPLDFAAVTDHSEYLGVVRERAPELPTATRPMRERLLEDGPLMNTIAFLRTNMGFNLRDVDKTGAAEISRKAWRETIEAAERHYEPGRFTTFVGYEWSSMPDARNLHRNVIYRSTKVPELPYSSIESEDPRDLWTALEEQRKQGMANLAIPHNGNVSDGLMYDSVALDGSAFDAEYARRRTLNEPISEIFQVKGASETHPSLSPEDPFADFNILDTMLSQEIQDSNPKGSYIRDALRVGMEFEHDQGFNPYRFGVIGSSDGHNASSPVEEDNHHGKLPIMDGSAAIRLGKAYLIPEEEHRAANWESAGLAAVWAEENTRESIFDAMRRKETYATSGPRMTVRFFAGAQYPEGLMDDPEWLQRAYASGVPMGGELQAASSEDTSPRFVVMAAKDPQGANLDRIQIIKGWVDASGQSHERIHDVALAENRQADPASKAANPVGNTVNIADASYTNAIGSPMLQVQWTDPDFSPTQHAFYYARVLEIPTPRWSTYDAKLLGVEAPEPATLQERAVTSAIWLQPASTD